MNLSVLVHTFNGYQRFWDDCARSWQPIAAIERCKFYLGTDEPSNFGRLHPFQFLYSGKGEWSDRLIRLLNQIPTDYILYAQEDHYPFRNSIDILSFLEIMEEKDLFRLQISPINQFYSLYGSEIPLIFHENSKYLVSHQPSIWKKSFLLDCLKPGENPWQNEYEGTKRLQKDPKIRGKIAIYPCDWYKHMCIKGKAV